MGLCESTNNKAPSTQTTTTSLTKPIYNTQSEGIIETNNTASLTKPVIINIQSEGIKTFNTALQEDREKLAQEMVAYLKTHDTGNNLEHYHEFIDLFHERAEAIADGGGYHKALEEIYYRVRFLCKEQGIDFHAGAVDNAFKGQYWRT